MKLAKQTHDNQPPVFMLAGLAVGMRQEKEMAIIFGDKEAIEKVKENEAFAKFGEAIKAAIMDTDISPYHMARIMFQLGDWYTAEYETITDWQEMMAAFRGE